jgi:hypothetical protein
MCGLSSRIQSRPSIAALQCRTFSVLPELAAGHPGASQGAPSLLLRLGARKPQRCSLLNTALPPRWSSTQLSGVPQTEVFANNETQVPLAWVQITSAYAYQRDCFAVDQFRLIPGDEIQRTWIEVTANDNGNEQLVVELAHHLPSCPTEAKWWQSVALPPFETQWKKLDGRTAETDR